MMISCLSLALSPCAGIHDDMWMVLGVSFERGYVLESIAQSEVMKSPLSMGPLF